jgi:hypothetical protein
MVFRERNEIGKVGELLPRNNTPNSALNELTPKAFANSSLGQRPRNSVMSYQNTESVGESGALTFRERLQRSRDF